MASNLTQSDIYHPVAWMGIRSENMTVDFVTFTLVPPKSDHPALGAKPDGGYLTSFGRCVPRYAT